MSALTQFYRSGIYGTDTRTDSMTQTLTVFSIKLAVIALRLTVLALDSVLALFFLCDPRITPRKKLITLEQTPGKKRKNTQTSPKHPPNIPVERNTTNAELNKLSVSLEGVEFSVTGLR